MEDETNSSRSRFLGAMTFAIGGLMSVGFIVPAIAYIVGPALKRGGTKEWITLGSTAKIEPGTPTLFKAKVKRQSGWIVTEEEISAYVLTDDSRNFVAMSNICTHLGCHIRWIAEKGQFFCPCHNAVFDKEGSVVAGPPPRPLDRYEVKVENGNLLILEVDMATRMANWLDERIGWRQVWSAIFLRKIPHVNWLYTLGSASLFVAVNQIVTGILLTIYYVPTPDHAYDSVQYITTQVPAGWLIRGLHHWGASAMVVLVVLHMLRVIYYGSYKFPREVTWSSGVLLLLIVVGFGFTGYLLPWDQKAYWATTVGTRIAATPPLIGNTILLIVRGGEELSAVTLARFFGVHIWVLPTALLLLILIHMFLVIRIGISAVPKREE